MEKKMKRMSLKRKMAAILALLMAANISACGNPGNEGAENHGTQNAGAQSSGAESSAASSASGEKEDTGRQTITISTVDVNAGENNTGEYAEQIFQAMEDFTGVDVELIWVANDVLADKNSLYLSTPKTMPNVITWGGTVTGVVVQSAKSGAFVDLTDYIMMKDENGEFLYPNLAGADPMVLENLTVDGKLIGIPRTRVLSRYGLCYRRDWAEKLGVELPENATPDDVYNMLYAFTYNDPDGNGVQDTIGMEMTSYTGVFDIIQTWFGCGNGWAEVDGRLVPVWMQDEYFEAADYIKKLYDDGLMPADWASRPTDTWSDGVKKGENGVYIDVMGNGKRIWQYYTAEESYTPSVVNPEEPASMELYGAIGGHTLATAGYNGYFTLSATTCDTEEKILAALSFLDKLSEPEMLLLLQYGIEGVNYELDSDGNIVRLDSEDPALAAGYKGLNQLLSYLPTYEAADAATPVKRDEAAFAEVEAYAKALPCAVLNPALSYTVNSTAYAEDGSYLDQKAAALRTQYICGEINKEEFKAGFEEIRAGGYDQIIEEVNEQYQSNK